jgi:cytoskeletal protein RodZ
MALASLLVGQITKIDLFVRNKGFSQMKNTIKNSLLITAAVATLAAGANLVLAQGVNERRDVPAAATPAQKAPEGKIDQKGVGPQKVESPKPAPNAQAPAKVNPAPLAQAPEKAAPAPHAQGSETTKPVTTGQAPDKAHPAPTAQAPDKATTSTPQNAQAPSKGAAPNPAAERGSKSDTSVVVSSEQHVKIREMLRGENNERLTNVSFSISVGQAIPQTVHL